MFKDITAYKSAFEFLSKPACIQGLYSNIGPMWQRGGDHVMSTTFKKQAFKKGAEGQIEVFHKGLVP